MFLFVKMHLCHAVRLNRLKFIDWTSFCFSFMDAWICFPFQLVVLWIELQRFTQSCRFNTLRSYEIDKRMSSWKPLMEASFELYFSWVSNLFKTAMALEGLIEKLFFNCPPCFWLLLHHVIPLMFNKVHLFCSDWFKSYVRETEVSCLWLF